MHGPNPGLEQAWPTHLGTPYIDESPALIQAFIALQQEAPGRVHCLLGNHEHAHVGGPRVSKFYMDEAAALEAQLDAAEIQQLRSLFTCFPLVAIAPCGVVLSHASPAAAIDSTADVERLSIAGYSRWGLRDFLRDPVLAQLLWARSATEAQAQRFLQALGGTLSIYGHDVVRAGYEREGEHQLCVSTSFGLFDHKKIYVELDLAAHYPNVHALRDGVELKLLWPERL